MPSGHSEESSLKSSVLGHRRSYLKQAQTVAELLSLGVFGHISDVIILYYSDFILFPYFYQEDFVLPEIGVVVLLESFSLFSPYCTSIYEIHIFDKKSYEYEY